MQVIYCKIHNQTNSSNLHEREYHYKMNTFINHGLPIMHSTELPGFFFKVHCAIMIMKHEGETVGNGSVQKGER